MTMEVDPCRLELVCGDRSAAISSDRILIPVRCTPGQPSFPSLTMICISTTSFALRRSLWTPSSSSPPNRLNNHENKGLPNQQFCFVVAESDSRCLREERYGSNPN